MQLIRYFFTVGLVVILITAFVTRFTNKGLRQSHVDFYGKMNAAFDSTKQTNALLVGSSRVLVHLDPKIIDSVTGLNSYNLGLNAASIKTCFNILSGAIKCQKKLKVVVLSIDYNAFSIEQDPYKDAYYYPFENEGLYVIKTDSGNVRLVHKIRLFDVSLYDDYVKYAAIDGLLRPKRILQYYKGYVPHLELNDFDNKLNSATAGNEITYSTEAFKILKLCIAICKQHNVKLIMVMAPYFKDQSPGKNFPNAAEYINTIELTAKQNEIPFYNYTNMSIAGEREYFYNVNHLNIKGATLYTKALADSIKKYLESN